MQRSSIEVQKSHRDQLESHHEQIEQEIEKAAEARGTLAKQRAKFRRLTLAFGLVLGLVAGILGVRAIELFVENPDDLPGLFRAFDVVVTAGLIAGGSDGIHQLVDTFVQYLERVRENQNT